MKLHLENCLLRKEIINSQRSNDDLEEGFLFMGQFRFMHFIFFISLVLNLVSLGCAQRGRHMPLEPQSIKSKAPGTNSPPVKPGTPADPNLPSCSQVTEFEVGYKEDILPIVEAKCSTCHTSGWAAAYWGDYKTMSQAKDKISFRVLEKKDMPMGGKLSEEELNTIKLWIDIGTPEERVVKDNSLCPSKIINNFNLSDDESEL